MPASAWFTLVAVTALAVANASIASYFGAGLDGIAWVNITHLLVIAGLMVPLETHD